MLINHAAIHVSKLGWRGIKNGELLRLAEAEGFEVLITADKGIEHQHDWNHRNIALVTLDIYPKNLVNLATCVREIDFILLACRAGSTHTIKGPHPQRP